LKKLVELLILKIQIMTTRRATGFPAQLNLSTSPHKNRSGAILGKETAVTTSDKKLSGESLEGAGGSHWNVNVSPAAPSTRRRGTGFPSQFSAASQQSAAPVFGQRKQKVHGHITSGIKEQFSTKEARKLAMEKICEDEISSHEREVVKMRKELYIQEKAKKQSIKKVTKKRRSMFSSSRRVVERVSMYILPKLSLHAAPGRMSAADDNILKYYTMNEIAKHNTEDSTWIVIHGRVYDVTSWMWAHPGREEVLQTNGGKDATPQFEGNFHSNYARDKAKQYVIGRVEGKKLGDLHENVKNQVRKQESWFTSAITGNMNLVVVILSIISIKLFVVYYTK